MYRHDKSNRPSCEDPYHLSSLSPHVISVSTVSRGHPSLVSLGRTLLKMVHPQNVQLLDVQLQNVQLQNVQLQNVHLPDVQLQNVQITKRPDYQTSLLPNVQLLNVQLQNVHTSNYYKISSFFLFSNTDNYDGFSPLKKYVLYLTLT